MRALVLLGVVAAAGCGSGAVEYCVVETWEDPRPGPSDAERAAWDEATAAYKAAPPPAPVEVEPCPEFMNPDQCARLQEHERRRLQAEAPAAPAPLAERRQPVVVHTCRDLAPGDPDALVHAGAAGWHVVGVSSGVAIPGLLEHRVLYLER